MDVFSPPTTKTLPSPNLLTIRTLGLYYNEDAENKDHGCYSLPVRQILQFPEFPIVPVGDVLDVLDERLSTFQDGFYVGVLTSTGHGKHSRSLARP